MAKSGKGQTKPDGRILSACQVLIETKIVVDGLTEKQLKGHLDQLNSPEQGDSFLLALTPDRTKPGVVDTIKHALKDRLRWCSFAVLNETIEEMLTDEKDVISEREQFLLREFQKLLADENLLEPEKNVVVIAARIAWDTYQKYHAYVCAPDRPLGQAKYLAFYSRGAIQPLVPEILEKFPEVVLERGKYPGNLGQLVNTLLDKAGKDVGETGWNKRGVQRFGTGDLLQVVFLTHPDDPRTIKLTDAVRNDQKAKSGKNVAFTMWQRYVSLPKLKEAKTTSDLD
jgi:hypothetical protein